eukprot:TRINITY_DN10168_c0_g1_i1.p1 TRINITY_DN10168_c0_g1~~TRINITY_DN10168_c0_g1_i1.p1  ORF type:complete len:439 (+),score=88.01 TRINITY_DN10168_c0_g1_i1:67-1317(+)
MKRRKSILPTSPRSVEALRAEDEEAEGLRIFLGQKKREMDSTIAEIQDRSRAEIAKLEAQLINTAGEKKLAKDELAAAQGLNKELERELSALINEKRQSDTLSVQVCQLSDELTGANIKINHDQTILSHALSQLEEAESEARSLHHQLTTGRNGTDLTTLLIFQDSERQTRHTIYTLESESRHVVLTAFFTTLDTLNSMHAVIDAHVAHTVLLESELAQLKADMTAETARLGGIIHDQEKKFELEKMDLKAKLQQTEVLAQQEAGLRGRQSIVIRELEGLREVVEQQDGELLRYRQSTTWEGLQAALKETQGTLDSMRDQFQNDLQRLEDEVRVRNEEIAILHAEIDGHSGPNLPWVEQELTTLLNELTTTTPKTGRTLREHVAFLVDLIKYWKADKSFMEPERWDLPYSDSPELV